MRTLCFGFFGLFFLGALVASCGSDSGAQSGGKSGSGAAGGTGGVLGTGGSGGVLGGSGGTGIEGGTTTCQTDADCGAGQICHPYSKECVAPGASCTAQSDCTGGTYCDSASGTCLPGTLGSPCATNANCLTSCSSGACGCSGSESEQELMASPLDIYFIFDRTASMGTDCAYVPGSTPPVASKACYATYALSNYLINVTPQTDTRLAFQFMSLALAPTGCDGTLYATPLIGLTQLPVAATDPLIQTISNETFAGGFGTEIEGALRGIAQYTTNNRTPGREMIGVLMTDGDPNGCSSDIQALSTILSDHLTATGIRTFIIGMQGATDANLEALGTAGGADPHTDWCGSIAPPCHYWNVADGSGDAIASALKAIIGQAAPLPCTFNVSGLTPPAGQQIDYGKVNVAYTDPNGNRTIIGQASDAGACPTNQPAWYYDNPASPSSINLCPSACNLVSTAPQGARVTVVVGCQSTVPVP